MNLEATLLAAMVHRYLEYRPTAVREWARDALEADHDSPALRELAGLDGDEASAEVDKLLRRCGTELGVAIPDRARCIAAHARSIAADIVAGACSPQAGAALLYRLACHADAGAELEPWIQIDDAVGLAIVGILATREDVEREIAEEAQRLLDGP